jgi:hypothetical protein
MMAVTMAAVVTLAATNDQPSSLLPDGHFDTVTVRKAD